MKILSIDKVREADRYTIENEPISSADLMERAAGEVFEWLLKRINKDNKVKIFCGSGNNGGDGLVVARRLMEVGFVVETYVIAKTPKGSPTEREVTEATWQSNLTGKGFDNSGWIASAKGLAMTQSGDNRPLTQSGNVRPLTQSSDFPPIDENNIIIDALFGSGLNRPIEGLAGELIEYLNQQHAIRVAIDIASGLFADSPSPAAAIFKPDYTLTFQQPKLAFMMPENDPYVGQLEVLDIQLHPQYLLEVETNNFLVDREMIKPIIHKRPKYSHKGTFGHALLVAGSEGKTGAAILGAKSCLRTGVGLLSVKLPQSAWTPLQASLPEAMLHTDDKLEKFNAIGVGPGLGTSDEAQRMVRHLIQDARMPLVMDADALNILGENKTWLSFLPPKTILTPHPKEFERMFGSASDSFERLALLREKAVQYGIIIVLKGAHTAVAMPNGTVFFNSTGNPGMATAGSGDVLTGMILSLLAQRYTPEEAAVLGVYLHGLAGDIAAEELGQEALIASDITEHIGNAYTSLQ